jgi:hypothetical protein
MSVHSFEVEIADHHKRERKKLFLDGVPAGIDIEEFAKMLQSGFEKELKNWKMKREPKSE